MYRKCSQRDYKSLNLTSIYFYNIVHMFFLSITKFRFAKDGALSNSNKRYTASIQHNFQTLQHIRFTIYASVWDSTNNFLGNDI